MELLDGLSNYGRIIGLRLEQNPCFPNCTGSCAFAAVVPKAEAGANGKGIPKVATITSAPEEPFASTVEGSLSPCSLCLSSTHSTAKCSVVDPDEVSLRAAVCWGTKLAKPTSSKPKTNSQTEIVTPLPSYNSKYALGFNLVNLPPLFAPDLFPPQAVGKLKQARSTLEARLKGVARILCEGSSRPTT